MKTQLLLHAMLSLAGSAWIPAAGELDPSFSQDGIAVSSMGTYAVARFPSDGHLDTGFGNQGIVITALGYTARATALSLQENGRILLAGWSSLSQGAGTHFTMVRYLPDGNLDPAFGSAGKVVTKIGSGSGMCQDIAIQSDGRILLGGTGGGFAVLRYAGNGAISFQAWAMAAGLEGENLEAVPGPQGSTLRDEFLCHKESKLTYVPKISASLGEGSFIPMNGMPQVSDIDALWERVVVEHSFTEGLPPQAFGVMEVTALPE